MRPYNWRYVTEIIQGLRLPKGKISPGHRPLPSFPPVQPLMLTDAISPALPPEQSLIADSTGVLNKLLAGTGIMLSYQPLTGDILISWGFAADNVTLQVSANILSIKAVPYSLLSGTPSTFPPSPHASTHGIGQSDDVTSEVTPMIWSVRLRSFNAIGNPNFEIDNRNTGALIDQGTNSAPVQFAQDRWQATVNTSGTMDFSTQRKAEIIYVPGTNYCISQYFLRSTLLTQQNALGSLDYYTIGQSVEGIFYRELALDVTSLQLLVRSSVAGWSFGLTFNGLNYTLGYLGTIYGCQHLASSTISK